jgi:hypothetical protein
MKIIITDRYNRTAEQVDFEEVAAIRVGSDHWRMTHTLFNETFDEYFTSDLVNLAREMVAPIH